MGTEFFWKKSTDTEQWKPFRRGFSFGEECAGTNAVSLALSLRKPAWTFPEQNYCALLSRFFLYALPVSIAIITTTKQPPDWPLATLQQMSPSMMLDMRRGYSILHQEKITKCLTRRQRMVFLQVARGLTDQAIAVELRITLNTVRFHKKKIYQLLGADNAISAVILALKAGIFTLEEI